MGPWISESAYTPDLLAENGYRYIMDWSADDQPFWMRTRSGRLLSIPYHIEINDSPAQLSRRHTADDFTQMVTAHFDEQMRQSQNQPLVFSLALHTFVVGQPYRLAGLRDILTQKLKREGRVEMAQSCFEFLPIRAKLDIEGWPETDIFSHS